MDKQKNTENKTDKIRQKAEMFLNKKIKSSELHQADSNNLRLIHELELHQIELELQNEEIKLAKEKAERAKNKYTELYDFAPSGYLTLSKTGEIIHLNYNAEHFLGKERSQLIKSSFGFFVSSDMRDVYNRFFQKIFQSKVKQTCELKLVTGDDSMKYVLVNGIISNNSEKCLLTLVDITKQKQTEYELIKAKEKAEESDRLKSAFLANMSHEIRTPMNGILGFTELLKNHKLKGEEQQEYIRIIEKSGTRMLNIINDIISISKIESHQVGVTYSDTDINAQVEYIYHFFKLEAEQKKLHFSFKNGLSAEESTIITDREKVYAILTNLVKNAMKFTQEGFIEIGYLKKDGFLEFYVKDSGAGVSNEQKEFIFERFRQGSEAITRNYEGAGLGLAISKAYVEMLGGEIWVESNAGLPSINGNRLNNGSTFYFTIPVNSMQKSEIISSENPIENEIKIQNRKLKILIVDDDKTSEMLIRILLEKNAREFLHASNGIQAIASCKNNPDIDLILMDINMPEMNGYEATRNIREFNTNVVIIAQTAYALSGDREKSIEAGCNDYISKPLSRSILNNMINEYFK